MAKASKNSRQEKLSAAGAKVKLFIAEDVRHEVGGKLTLLGLFPDDTILLHISKEQSESLISGISDAIVAIKLVFVFSVSNLDGEYEISGQFLNPQEDLHGEPFPSSKFKVAKGQSQTIIIGGEAFPLPTDGTYSIQLNIDKSTYKFPLITKFSVQDKV